MAGRKTGCSECPETWDFIVIMGNMALEFRREFAIFIGAV
jgi:hypothetical protein